MDRKKLHKIALRRLATNWPYLDKELAEKIAGAMVDFHLEIRNMKQSTDGVLLADFFKEKGIHQADRKTFYQMLNDLIERTEFNAWKEGRRWVVGHDSVDDLWKHWNNYIERGKQ